MQQVVMAEQRVFTRPIAYQHDIYIDSVLSTPDEWRDVIEAIRNTSAQDVIHLRLNGLGGSDSVMGGILKAMAETEAHIVGHIEHHCCSALTIIFLACDEFVVSDDAEFMIHTASLGYASKQNNFNEYAMFVNKSNEKLMRKYYQNFLSNEEITKVISGTDMWMTGEDVVERLGQRSSKETEMVLDELSRDELKSLAEQAEINFPPKTSTERLRTMLKDKI